MRKILLIVTISVIFLASTQIVIAEKEIAEKEQERVVIIFFGNLKEDPQTLYCDRVYPVVRRIVLAAPRTEALVRAALEALLKGPTKEEKNQGFFTNINPGVEIQSLSIDRIHGGTVKVDFNEQLEAGIAGSCLVLGIRAQIERTIKQFMEIDDAIVSIDGRTEDVLQP